MSFYLRNAAEFASYGCYLASYACVGFSGLILGNERAKCSGPFYCAFQEPITELKVIGIWYAAYLFHRASTWLDNCSKERNVTVMSTHTPAAQSASQLAQRQIPRDTREKQQ